MSSELLLHLSDFNNNWNKEALHLARESERDGLIDMTHQRFSDIDHSRESFLGAYESRKLAISANNKSEYNIRRVLVGMMKPFYYLAHEFYKMKQSV